MFTNANTPATYTRIVREAERLIITGVPRATWWQLVREGKAPKPIPLGAQARGWSLEELLNWVSERISDRDRFTPRSAEMRRRSTRKKTRAQAIPNQQS